MHSVGTGADSLSARFVIFSAFGDSDLKPPATPLIKAFEDPQHSAAFEHQLLSEIPFFSRDGMRHGRHPLYERLERVSLRELLLTLRRH